jgi:subtilase family serine protease
MVRSVPKVRIAVISAAVVALSAAVAAAVLPASAAAPLRVAGQAASGQATSAAMTAEVRPDFTRIPGVARQTPPTTSQCEQSLRIACYTPNQIRAAYQLPTLYGREVTGRGETIVIEDSYGSPTIKSDLATFDRQFGYPNPPKFSVIQPIGKVATFNPKNANMAGWPAAPS